MCMRRTCMCVRTYIWPDRFSNASYGPLMWYLAPRRIGSAGPKTADNAGADMVPPCRKWPPLEFAEVERLCREQNDRNRKKSNKIERNLK